MKDEEARTVINLLTQRINQLRRELKALKTPHPNDCKCDVCSAWSPDHFLHQFSSHGYATWWKSS